MGRIGWSQLGIEIAAKRRQIEQNFVLTGIGKSWVGFRLVHIQSSQPANAPPNTKILNLKTPLNYGETVADGANFELIAAAKSQQLQMHQNMQ